MGFVFTYDEDQLIFHSTQPALAVNLSNLSAGSTKQKKVFTR
jgi:hypothetical protein